MNYADSVRIKSVLANCGFEYVDSQDEADILILILVQFVKKLKIRLLEV